jgi:hypothetical protein
MSTCPIAQVYMSTCPIVCLYCTAQVYFDTCPIAQVYMSTCPIACLYCTAQVYFDKLEAVWRQQSGATSLPSTNRCLGWLLANGYWLM